MPWVAKRCKKERKKRERYDAKKKGVINLIFVRTCT